ncbi:MAG: 16S rRNA processing protein RimM [Acidobacteria bacterium]|jgi:16S rRNA processing protein RimM|nr:16S rRNA processing protein RimM [Acidobacteriota bacterium]
MQAKSDDRLIAVGVLRGAHGVRGEVRVKSYTADPDALFTYGPLLDETGAVVLTPKSARPGKDHFIVRPKEMKQKEEWDSMRGRLLHVPRGRLPAAADDEFYVEDLAGMEVQDGAGSRMGRVKSVQNFGSGDLLEVEVAGLAATVFVPFTLADVPQVDVAARRVTIPDLATWSEPAGTLPPGEDRQ